LLLLLRRHCGPFVLRHVIGKAVWDFHTHPLALECDIALLCHFRSRTSEAYACLYYSKSSDVPAANVSAASVDRFDTTTVYETASLIASQTFLGSISSSSSALNPASESSHVDYDSVHLSLGGSRVTSRFICLHFEPILFAPSTWSEGTADRRKHFSNAPGSVMAGCYRVGQDIWSDVFHLCLCSCSH
jgi:hypothetical protein